MGANMINVLIPRNWHLVTAEIFYFLPDHRQIINPRSFTRQFIDDVPKLPELKEFLRWWDEKLDGKIHSVEWAAVPLLDHGNGIVLLH